MPHRPAPAWPCSTASSTSPPSCPMSPRRNCTSSSASRTRSFPGPTAPCPRHVVAEATVRFFDNSMPGDPIHITKVQIFTKQGYPTIVIPLEWLPKMESGDTISISYQIEIDLEDDRG